MELKNRFENCKNYVTDGHPDIFWTLIGWSCAIVVVTIGIAHLGVSFMRYKGLL
jgi:hypothetical protein